MSEAFVASLHLYPIKGCRGIKAKRFRRFRRWLPPLFGRC